jgi:hypothetical protein
MQPKSTRSGSNTGKRTASSSKMAPSVQGLSYLDRTQDIASGFIFELTTDDEHDLGADIYPALLDLERGNHRHDDSAELQPCCECSAARRRASMAAEMLPSMMRADDGLMHRLTLLLSAALKAARDIEGARG